MTNTREMDSKTLSHRECSQRNRMGQNKTIPGDASIAFSTSKTSPRYPE